MKETSQILKALILAMMVAAPMSAKAQTSLNRLGCKPAGMNENLLFEFSSESDVPGTYETVGSLRVMNGLGQATQGATNVRIQYVLTEVSHAGYATLTHLFGDLGRSGDIQVVTTPKGQAIIHSTFFSPNMSFPAGKVARCVFMSHIEPKPAISGSN